MEENVEMKGGLPDRTIEDLEKNREWWWVAEKRRSKRLDYLRKAVWKKGAKGGVYTPGLKIDLERPVLFTEAWKANEDDPGMIRRAKGVANVMDNISIFITDHAQIMGYVGSLPHTQIWYQEVASMFNEEYYNTQGSIPEPVDESLKVMSEINNYWAGKTELDKVIRIIPPEDAVKLFSGVIMWGVPIGATGSYSAKDYEYIMTGKRGFEDIYNEIQERIEDAEEKLSGIPGPDILPLYDRLPNWEAMQFVIEAGIRYAKRYARLARIIAENFESDPKRKEELMRIADVCEQVPASPPRNLHESLQYDFFVNVLQRLESLGGAWPSRTDYYHGPYYDLDVNIEKRITKGEALDLIGEFLIRIHEIGQIMPSFGKEGLQGIPGTYVGTLGGVKPDGTDACNDMTIAILEAARLVRVANPTFGFRWHPQVKDEVMREVFECIRQGLGFPSIRNDPILVANTMHWYGHPLEEARLWVHQACMSPCPPTKHGTQPFRMASTTLNTSKMIEYALHNGYDHVLQMQMGPETGDARKFVDFEQLFEAWKKQMQWMTNIAVRVVNLGRVKCSEHFGSPMLSALYERAVESGLDCFSPEGERGNAWISWFTWVENVDSLAAVKKLVFDEKKYTMTEIIDACAVNWEGKEKMRLDFVKNAPKWGNDDDYVDQIMVRCMREIAKQSWEMKCPSGNSWPVLPQNVSGNIHFAPTIHALPNGRRLGDALYDGGISPGPGLDKKGPTAILKSCGKIDHISDGRAFLLNQRLSPTQLSGEKGYQLWKAYIKTWADLGLDHVQFNMVDDATLRAAQRDPEQYQEVIVRVAGYSAHFVDISRKTQDNIIQRTVQGLG
ncbi:MAG: pyruvate formate lyase family protein [Spirochaetota bacterium]|nr:pyruvate formate lyase family protein [Spirochaetota bacterium]